ncbi:LysR family transcriptional regulator [Oceanimonas sp. GK1]|uniref:LysR substrate-binding domain-containing protein n=1 Tax=Oceanimonas sp. (strain GK1 / IBRC-M 10197) TaxID=511062 RepID=UPI00024955E9|nr:LysR substrate-binding domain-containing protein [Oceanimonas sp. GK1]AEY02528.1 LysR family transcriptional regulator [Oceanimonas sp. GK1]
MTIPFTFRQLGYFVAVAQHGSISKAAGALHVSQPSVSIAIAQLEGLLGQPLFQRHRGQGVSLSPRGEALFRQARHILALSQHLLDSQHQHGTEVEGQLVLGCFRDIAPYYLPRLVSEFERRYPRIGVTMQEQDLAGVREGLEQGKTELVVSYGLGLPPEYRLHVLDELRPYALLPVHHALANQTQLSLAELAEETLILQDLPLTREYFLSLFWHRDLQPARIHHTLSFEMQRGLVAHGHGVALSCTRPAGDQSYDGAPIACLPLSDEVPPQRVMLARSPAFPLSLPARLFVEQVTGQPALP